MAEGMRNPQERWRATRLGTTAALALTVAACVGRREPVVDTPEPTSEKPDAPGDVPSNLPRDVDRNRVAVLVPLTGPNAGVGTSIANAANLALLDSGGTGIRITVYDTGTDAAAAATTALADGNQLFLGPLLAEDVRAVAPVARKGRVPVIAFSNDDGVAGNGTYLMGFSPDQSIERVVRYARDKGAVRFAGVVPEGPYGQRAGQALTAAVGRAGGRTVAVQGYTRNAASLAAATRTLNAKAGYDAVLVADGAQLAATAVPTIRTGGRRAQILGTELWSTDRAIGTRAALRGALFAGVPDARFDQLVTRYRARYGKTPYRLASLGYDATLLAVRIGREWPVATRFPQSKLPDPQGFSGIDGAFRFRSDGTAERRMAVHEVVAGATRVVSPAPTGF